MSATGVLQGPMGTERADFGISIFLWKHKVIFEGFREVRNFSPRAWKIQLAVVREISSRGRPRWKNRGTAFCSKALCGCVWVQSVLRTHPSAGVCVICVPKSPAEMPVRAGLISAPPAPGPGLAGPGGSRVSTWSAPMKKSGHGFLS